MHGRLKVKSPAHLEQERLAAKQKKLEGYKAAMKAIFDLRGATDDGDQRHFKMLQLSENVLLNSAAVSTLWNVRKQVLLERIPR